MSVPAKGGRPLSLLALAVSALRATKHVAPTSLPHWYANGHGSGVEAVRDALRRINSVDGDSMDRAGPGMKGQPNVQAIKAELARDIMGRLDANPHEVDAATLEAAHRLVALDMSDAAAYEAYVALLRHSNAAALQAARPKFSNRIVMHMSCQPRINRAQDSCASFGAAVQQGISQVIVVGSPQTHLYHFDPATDVLTVPAGDGYEHLPAKVIAAMTFFALCEHVEAVLKIDDDHRLASADALAKYFARAHVRAPIQLGKRNNVGVLGNHVRVWHFGKCANPALGAQPYTLPGASRWINGAAGYVVNQAALRLLLWSHVYFPEYIRIGLYEDMTVSDLIERQGGRLIHADMSRILRTVEHY